MQQEDITEYNNGANLYLSQISHISRSSGHLFCTSCYSRHRPVFKWASNSNHVGTCIMIMNELCLKINNKQRVGNAMGFLTAGARGGLGGWLSEQLRSS